MSGNNIKVVCRFRPMNRMEVENKSDMCMEIDADTTIQLRNSSSLAGPEKDGFTFDRVFGVESQQQEIFDWGVKGIVEDVMMGFNGTLFCYGQTGSGKTFTMMGADIMEPHLKGMIPRLVEQVFASILAADSNVEYTVKVSYMEIYMEKIKDLLAPHNDNLSIHEDKARGVHVKNLTEVYVSSEAEVYKVMRAGGASRAVSSTQMNAESSRSHSIFVVSIHQRDTEKGTQKSGNLYLVDLAGSEKIGKTGATGQTLEEAKKINKSLSALGMVINSLTDGKSTHIPYRDSKLTRILQESLGGNSRTTLIINCSPATYNEPETLSTLRFGMRAKSIKNKAKINVEMSPAELKAELKRTVAALAASREYAAKLELELKGEKGELALPVSRPETRPETPMDRDERDEFLKRENELSDQLAEKESAMATLEKMMADLRDEVVYIKEQEALAKVENKAMVTELGELRIASARFETEAKDGAIVLDTYKDKVAELQRDLEEQRIEIDGLQHSQAREKDEEKEKRKAEMLQDMLSKLDIGFTAAPFRELLDGDLDEQHKVVVRRHLAESQTVTRDLQERLRQAQNNLDAESKRREDVERAIASNAPDAVLQAEIDYLKEQLESRAIEARKLQLTLESFKLSNEELNNALSTVSAAGSGADFAQSTQDLERTRKAYDSQFAEFETIKKSLMKDLQNRCEKVVELEMQLDEVKEQYKVVAKSAHSKTQAKKLGFLEHNLEQLNGVQRQLVEQNSALKKEAAIAERKLMTRNDRIAHLETLLSAADARLTAKSQKVEQQLQALRDRLESARAGKPAPVNFGRIAKPVRGGQGDESASSKRQSWFFANR